MGCAGSLSPFFSLSCALLLGKITEVPAAAALIPPVDMSAGFVNTPNRSDDFVLDNIFMASSEIRRWSWTSSYTRPYPAVGITSFPYPVVGS